MQLPNGEKYDGEFKNGNLDGYGIFYYKGGEKYICGFKNKLLHGYGMLIYKDNSVKFGKFENDKEIKLIKPNF